MCLGKPDEFRRIFVTDDRRRYFSVCNGWGKRDGKLVALNITDELIFEGPMGVKELREYIDDIPHASGLYENIFRDMKIKYIEQIIGFLQETEADENISN